MRALVEAGFRRTDEMSEEGAGLRTRQVLASPDRLRAEIGGWLAEATRGRFLDLGCGPGMLLAAAAAAAHAESPDGALPDERAPANGDDGRTHGIGVDVCLTWLVVARYLVALHAGGRTPELAAAFAEALPLRDGAVDAVVSLDVVEHVADPVPYLVEIDRVTRPGGVIALATPNRYSLTAEPHVCVWGVGWLPRRWQKRFVRWRSGRSYEFVRLLSPWELAALVRRHTRFAPELASPRVSDVEIARFPAWRATLARAYNRVVSMRWTRPATLGVGPFFHLLGRKPR